MKLLDGIKPILIVANQLVDRMVDAGPGILNEENPKPPPINWVAKGVNVPITTEKT